MSTRTLLRVVGSLFLAGVVFWAVLNGGIALLKSAWPGYALAAPERAYSLSMLLVRLVLFGLAIAAAGAAAALASQRARIGWVAGLLIFAASIPSHLYPGYVWDSYPAWYHYAYLLSIVPFAVAGSRLVRSGRSGAARARAAA